MSGLSAKAKPFVFNPSASTFNPGAAAFQLTAAPPAIAEKAVDTFDLTSDAHPQTAPSAGSSDDWEELAEEKSQATIPIPVPTTSASTSSPSPSPPPPLSPPAVDVDVSSPPAPQSPTPPPTSLPSDLSSPIAALALDAEESKILAEAAEEEAEEVKKGVKKLDTDRVAHDDREHLNIVFIGHVDAGKVEVFHHPLSLIRCSRWPPD